MYSTDLFLGNYRLANQLARRFVLLLACVTLLSNCVFQRLEGDLRKLDDVAHLFTGVVSTDVLEFHSTLVVALQDRDAGEITSFRMMSGPGVFEIRAARTPTYFFAFGDMNKDLKFQVGEPYGWAAQAQALMPMNDATRGIDIVIRPDEPLPYPEFLVDVPLENHLNNYVNTHIGTVSSLDDPLFSNRQGKKGLWEPFAFMEDGGTGIHFLEAYDPSRVPVLFVHGINGAPSDFSAVIGNIDRSRFQPWILSYPSGLRLSWLARGMFQFIEALHRQYGFKELHVVAHSMGGLVSRGCLNLCVQNDRCGYLRSFTTLSTPWDGVASAQSGVKWAPTVVPVWNDLSPDSDFVSTLFDTKSLDGVPHHLVFGFRQDNFLSSGSSDGVIQLSSQLRDAAQEQAWTIRGYDEGHASILRSSAVIGNVNWILRQQGP
jgi:pimeloyl-ACP methyl ester carboxylesterase